MNRSIAVLAAGLLATTAFAQELPRSFTASPDVYKVVAENAQFKVIEVTWKPGQRDKPHGHPASAVYYLSDCTLRLHAPDGSFRDVAPRAGHSVVQAPIPNHTVENRGSSDCRLVMFEPA